MSQVDKVNSFLSSSNSKTWPDEQNLVIGSDIDGEPISEGSLENLLNFSSKKLLSLKFVQSSVTLPCNLFDLIGMYCPNLTIFECCSLKNLDWSKFQVLPKKCKNLTTLSLIDQRTLRDEHLGSVFAYGWKLTTLKLHGTAVTKSTLSKLPNSLDCLDLRGCKFVSIQSLLVLKQRCPRLTTLYSEFILDQDKFDDICSYWPGMQRFICSTKCSLNIGQMKNLSEVFLNSSTTVSMKPLVTQLRKLSRLQLHARSLRNEILQFVCPLKILILETDEPMPCDIVLSLPYCLSLEILDVSGSDIHEILEELLNKCANLKYVKALDSLVGRDHASKLYGYAAEKSTPTIIDIYAVV